MTTEGVVVAATTVVFAYDTELAVYDVTEN